MSALLAGVDEAGRGPLAGPVVAAAVILDPARPIRGLRDSKQLTPQARAVLAARIRERALAVSVAEADHDEIDLFNILQATLLAMKWALLGLGLLLAGAALVGCAPHWRVVQAEPSDPMVGQRHFALGFAVIGEGVIEIDHQRPWPFGEFAERRD